ncbi:hypothetical protein [Agromyces sp. SYSU T00194]|uniref:hypothetical protein n=1 Tax=Agromyces chitinivorans TaxID=3158560 RepID=UPI003396A695
MRIRPTRRAHLAALALAPAVALAPALAGCAAASSAARDAASQAAARAAAADLARGLYRHGTDTIDDYARWADADTAGGSIELIGTDAYAGAVHGEPFGALRFRVTLRPSGQGAPYVACFASEFDYWGVVTPGRSGWDDDRAVARDVDCPPDATRIEPPEDTRTVYVVPDGTEELVVEVLAAAPASPSADEVVAEVRERMPRPTGEREAAFAPAAVVRDGEIGFAMGDADDCLLVRRDARGVQVLRVPRVRLLPGELGCGPDTALAPDELLSPPH